eukprot:RCo036873
MIREVWTRTLASILVEACAPARIEYLSLDVEGSEYRVLQRFPFQRYRFSVLTIEKPKRDLCLMLHHNGYRLVGVVALFESLWVHQDVSVALLRGPSVDFLRSLPGLDARLRTALQPLPNVEWSCQALHQQSFPR